ncbi:MAG: beta-N-acetylhexosaminidase [bacterium]
MNTDVIPAPTHLRPGIGRFVVEASTSISADAPFLPLAQYLSEVLSPAIGGTLKVQKSEPLAGATSFIHFSTGDANLGEEGYELDIHPDRILIRASKPAGAFYACQTLRQLLQSEVWYIPCLSIQDQPRFPWRGLMLDTARQFLSKDFVKRYIDLLAYYKMNRLHLHLTDNDAWTLEIKQYPQLTETDRWLWQADVQKSRGVYSQEDIREIVAYATSRYVVVVPEIEMPAHSINSQLAMRDLLCPNNPWRKAKPDWKQWPEVEPGCTTWPDQNLIAAEYCMGSEKTFEFLETVLTEVMDLFPSPWIHIGGDEYLGNTWSQCPLCQARQATLAHEDSPEIAALHRNAKGDPKKYLLYRYGMRRMAKFVVAKGRIPIMWDTLAWGGKYPAGAVVHQWHPCGEQDEYEQTDVPGNPIVDAIENGHEVINSSCSHLYFDYDMVKTPLDKVYGFEPVPDQLPEDKRKHILGAHAPVWGQRPENVDRQTFPRLLALAELNWSAVGQRDWASFQRRLPSHEVRLKDFGKYLLENSK